MKKFLKKILIQFYVFVVIVGTYLSLGKIAFAQNYGLDTAANTSGGGTNPFPSGGLDSYVGSIVGAVLAFVGILFFILMIYAGILWMTARGNEEQVTKAKNLITAAIIGLIIVMSAYAITAFVGQQVS